MSDRLDAGPGAFRRYGRLALGALPAITLATIIPLALFDGVSAVAGLRAGIIASLAWAWRVERLTGLAAAATLSVGLAAALLIAWMMGLPL